MKSCVHKYRYWNNYFHWKISNNDRFRVKNKYWIFYFYSRSNIHKYPKIYLLFAERCLDAVKWKPNTDIPSLSATRQIIWYPNELITNLFLQVCFCNIIYLDYCWYHLLFVSFLVQNKHSWVLLNCRPLLCRRYATV